MNRRRLLLSRKIKPSWKPTHNLPSEYTEVEWIQRGNIVIAEANDTFNLTNDNVSFVLDYDLREVTGQQLFLISGGTLFQWGNENILTPNSTGIVGVQNVKYVYGFRGSNGGTITVGEGTKARLEVTEVVNNNFTMTVTNRENNQSASMEFTKNSAGTPTKSIWNLLYNSAVKINEMQIFVGGVLAVNYVPCLNNSTGLYGLYDTERNVFNGGNWGTIDGGIG